MFRKGFGQSTLRGFGNLVGLEGDSLKPNLTIYSNTSLLAEKGKKMTATIPENMRDLLTREKRAFAFLALPMPDGSPHATIVWFDWDGAHVIINTARGRVKDKLLHARPRVAIVIPDPQSAYRYLQIRGPVVEETEEGAYDVICSLNEKYHGKYEFPRHPGQVRVTYKILPERITAYV